MLHSVSNNRIISNLETIEILCSMRDNPALTINETVDFHNIQLIKELVRRKIVY